MDSWAWWEVLHDTDAGKRITRSYLRDTEVRLVAVDLALAELSAKLAGTGRGDAIAETLRRVEAAADITSIGKEAAAGAGALLVELRRADKDASLADAVMLAVARTRGAKLLSTDPCFAGQKDVVRV